MPCACGQGQAGWARPVQCGCSTEKGQDSCPARRTGRVCVCMCECALRACVYMCMVGRLKTPAPHPVSVRLNRTKRRTPPPPGRGAPAGQPALSRPVGFPPEAQPAPREARSVRTPACLRCAHLLVFLWGARTGTPLPVP